jgi:glycerol-3-phosphate dehydrogenase (NAD(P)+)
MHVTVLGAGSFGSSLANILAANAESVRLWAREEALAQAIRDRHENPTYLPGIPLSPKVSATNSMEQALSDAGLVVLAIPSHAMREVLQKAKGFLPRHTPLVSVIKGIENGTLYTMTEVLEDVLPEEHHPYLAVLSGPSFAKEVAKRMPTAVTVAAQWDRVAERVRSAFQTESFRVYTSTDVRGVELGGALKNVIAIAAGIADGLGFGHNARAGLITRGLAEMTRLAVRRGANPLTLSGLSGLGDLVLTCTGELSRNRRVGFELGQGRTLAEILGDMKEVAEGVKTAQSARGLAAKLQVELPICEKVHEIIQGGKEPRAAVVELMTRQPRTEL